ncbi:Protein of unknown function [Paracoccus halophilus]|uniref:Phosphonate metabolism protein n=1 Tax=Paracoccus halophilus TaxID=376733 RepID=A0A099F2E5_9RHOB|nr:DUF1045 domain-containing protein [Paracoccus halophilus]KGJ04579.1 hypothetical protein IT41_09480 [Paracoccus halophilus]SFA50133.1 Protein of unknown function [Paracoccus halophilus]
MQFHRYAIYHLPEGALADFGAAWLGWDARTGRHVARPEGLPGNAEALTRAPRRYGFHATLKAPFRLAAGRDPAELARTLRMLCDRLSPCELQLEPRDDHGFLALRPQRQPPELLALESSLVTRLDEFRAPLTPQEYDRRNPDLLPARARMHLDHWGYPFVLDLFGYHLTLSGALPPAECALLHEALSPHLTPLIAAPIPLRSVALMGEDGDGFFHLIEDVPLRG